MKNVNLSQLKPISALPRKYSDFADAVQDGEELIFLRHNTPYVVLLDFERWQKLVDLEQQQAEQVALKDIQQSESEYRSGQAKPLTSLADLT